MVRRPGRVEAEMQMEDARMTLGEVAVGGGDMAEIGAPVGAWVRQLNRSECLVGHSPHQLLLRAEMVQHGHGIDADDEPKLAHRETKLSLARQHGEGRIEDRALVESPPPAPARASLGLSC